MGAVSNQPDSSYIFHGCHSECTEGRFVETWVEKTENQLKIREYFLTADFKLCDEYSIIYILTLPEHFKKERIIGRPICIGCKDELFIIQYITVSCRFIRFMAVHLSYLSGKHSLQCFEDTLHFFNSDFTATNPLRCHISPDKSLCLLRLPQDITKPKKWTKILAVKKQVPAEPISSENAMVGTDNYNLRDRKFHCILFQENGDILTADIEQYCARCRFNVVSAKTGKSVSSQIVHRIEVPSVFLPEIDSSDSDSIEEAIEYFILNECSMSYNRRSDLLVLCCYGVTNLGDMQCKLFIYDVKTLQVAYREDIHLDKKIVKHDKISLLIVFSSCDTKFQVWAYKRGASHHSTVKEINLESVLNQNTTLKTLKELCRQSILSRYSLFEILQLPLPPSLIKYIQFR